jgi:biopolymer transport protein TolQ
LLGVNVIIPLLTAPGARLNVFSLVLEAGPMSKFVIVVLIAFSIASWAIMAERHRRFRRAEEQSRAFLDLSLNPTSDGSSLGGESLEAVARVLRKNASVQMAELERSLGFLATTASATPFIGLFGTVWGIMNAFRGIGVSGTTSLAAYAPGIAEALVATAAGLAAAIPAVIGYNYYLGRLRGMDLLIDEFIADFIHRTQGRRS